jgi:hypothetical protein
MTFERDDYDGNTAARLDYEALEVAQTVLYEQALTRARDEFVCGYLDDEVRDAVADYPADAVMIALYAVYGEDSVMPRSKFAPAFVDFGLMVDDIIEKRVQFILEDE